MSDDKRMITPAEAMELMLPGVYVHTFRNPGGALLGADIRRIRLESLLQEFPDTIEIAGDLARRMKHGIIVTDQTGPLFIETDPEKLNAFDHLPNEEEH